MLLLVLIILAGLAYLVMSWPVHRVCLKGIDDTIEPILSGTGYIACSILGLLTQPGWLIWELFFWATGRRQYPGAKT